MHYVVAGRVAAAREGSCYERNEPDAAIRPLPFRAENFAGRRARRQKYMPPPTGNAAMHDLARCNITRTAPENADAHAEPPGHAEFFRTSDGSIPCRFDENTLRRTAAIPRYFAEDLSCAAP
ncbi:hypothetical protein [Burkholderia diffusa]|uniref:hypothetical protein n=1 Tax=Burkholderia diffusa TaxID=488732 RepID=UPI002AB1F312|nr:hypothetical protein [Burkholderia diffusa]